MTNGYGFSTDGHVIGDNVKTSQEVMDMVERMVQEGTRKNGRRITSYREALEVVQVAFASGQFPFHETLTTDHRPAHQAAPVTLESRPAHAPQEKPSLVHGLTHLVSRYDWSYFPVPAPVRRFYRAMAAGLFQFRAVWRQE